MDYTACVYDEDGRLIRKIGGTSGGYGAWTSEEYTYDSEDHIVEVIYSALTSTSARDMSDWKSASVQGDPYRETRSYDGDLLKEAVRYKPDGSVYYHEYYTYDEEGRLLQKETKDDGGNQSQLITYTYNEDGLLIEEEQLGSRAVTILYEYDEEGRLSKERNMYTQYSYTYLYDENGNLHLKRTYNAGGAMTWEYEYFYRKFPFEE
jgi:YD repeat-containing protein